MYLNIIKTFHLFNSKNILGKFYATTAPTSLIEKTALGFSSKKRSANSVLFVASDAALNF